MVISGNDPWGRRPGMEAPKGNPGLYTRTPDAVPVGAEVRELTSI